MVTILTSESIEEYRKSLSVKGRSGPTIRAYVADLNGLLNWYQSSQQGSSTFEELASLFLNESRKTQAAKTVNRKLATFRGFAKFHGDHAALKEYSAPTPGKQHPHPLTEGVSGVERMIAAAKTDDEKAIAVLCGLVSLRISEAREVRPSHFNLSTEKPILTVRGKGDKIRYIPVGSKAWAILQPMYVRLLPVDMKLILLSDSAARRAWSRLGRNAELGRHTSSHDGRATVATSLLDKGANIRIVQEILGHASLETTQIYTGVTMRDMSKAMEL